MSASALYACTQRKVQINVMKMESFRRLFRLHSVPALSYGHRAQALLHTHASHQSSSTHSSIDRTRALLRFAFTLPHPTAARSRFVRESPRGSSWRSSSRCRVKNAFIQSIVVLFNSSFFVHSYSTFKNALEKCPRTERAINMLLTYSIIFIVFIVRQLSSRFAATARSHAREA